MYAISRYLQTVASKKRKRHMQARELQRLRAWARESKREIRQLQRRQRRLERRAEQLETCPGEPLVADASPAAEAAPRGPLSW